MLSALFRINVCAAFLMAFALSAVAQDFPTKPIKILVGYATGGPTDVITRILAQEMSVTLGQSVLVENRTGASGNIATEAVAKATPDGYTLVASTLAHNINPLLLPNTTKYDPIREFAPVSLAVVLPQLVVVSYDSPFNSLTDIIKQAKTSPGSVTYGSAGVTGSSHLASAFLAYQGGVQLTPVPFRGNAPALTEVMAGRVSFMFYPMIGVNGFVQDKRLRVLAVTTTKRNPDFPNVATTAEQGFTGFDEYVGGVGLLATAGTPVAVVQKLSAAARAALKKSTVRDQLGGMGAIIVGSTPEEFTLWMKADADRWAQLIKIANIKGE
jgi:tripartite-type tricarboxylate transporter receptor subunit TctC